MELKKMISNSVVVPKGTQYLSELYPEGLPDNVILNKGITGCGATTSAIMEDRKYVIAMPYRELIINKKKDCEKFNKDYLTVYGGGHQIDDIINFSGTKILVTYDSLPKVVEALGESISDWKIMVDECHKIIDDAAFRPLAMRGVLANYKQFGSFIFATATPIPQEFQLQELLEVPNIYLQWDKVIPVRMNFTLLKRKDFYMKVAFKLKQHHTGKINGNAHIFINSVKDIKYISELLIKLIGVDKNDISVTCANNLKNEKTLGLIGLSVIPAGSNVKKFNFYTSTAFEGCDIFDETGRTYIVTDGQRDYTKVAIETSLPQIVGRIRNSKYKHEIYMMYSASLYHDSSNFDEFKNQLNLQLIEAQKNIISYQNILTTVGVTKKHTSTIFNELKEDVFVYHCNINGFTINELAAKNELYKYTVYNQNYFINDHGNNRKNDIIKTESQPIMLKNVEYDGEEISAIEKLKLTKRPNFSLLLKEYITVKESEKSYGAKPTEEYEAWYPIFKDAFKYLGSDKIRKLKFRKKDISDETRLAKNMGTMSKMIVAKLNYQQNNKYTTCRIIEDLNRVFHEVGVRHDKVKATLLEKWYQIIRCTVPLKNGKQGNGYKIIRCKIVMN